MLQRLTIRHFAIIDELDLSFIDGLTILTGETGAGKSILVGALNLVMGGRASADLVRTGCDYAEIMAEFVIPPQSPVYAQLSELGIEAEACLTVRRQVMQRGRSRAWINDHPVTAGSLSEIGEQLIDISSQHQHQSLLQVDQHLFLLDRVGGLEGLREEVTLLYRELAKCVKAHRKLENTARYKLEREDFLRFQLKELDRADFRENEEDELEAERDLLRHSEKIRGALTAAAEQIGGDSGAASRTAKTKRELERIQAYLKDAREWISRLQTVQLELDDLSLGISERLRKLDIDPKRLDEVETRLALLARLLRKHGPTFADLKAKQAEMQTELAAMEDLEAALDGTRAAIEHARKAVLGRASVLSEKRRMAASHFSEAVEDELRNLAMPKTRFVVRLSPKSAGSEETIDGAGVCIGPDGIDHVEFLLSPNVGESLRPLARIASGGELSRIMLAIKSVLQSSDPVSLSVFDEVDSGIGGEVAHRLGEKIHALSRTRQAICITHLPQIAAYADTHWHVTKTVTDNRTFSEVSLLSDDNQRAMELAHMMAGEATGSASLQAAHDLLRHARSAVQADRCRPSVAKKHLQS